MSWELFSLSRKAGFRPPNPSWSAAAHLSPTLRPCARAARRQRGCAEQSGSAYGQSSAPRLAQNWRFDSDGFSRFADIRARAYSRVFERTVPRYVVRTLYLVRNLRSTAPVRSDFPSSNNLDLTAARSDSS